MSKIKKILSLVLVSGIIFSTLIVGCNNNKRINFADKNLEKVIRNIINKPTGDILKSDFDYVTSLRASDCGITNLSGIENWTTLRKLNLQGNQITDIAPLKGLINLTELALDDNGISNIEPLKKLTNLNLLSLSYNQVTSIEPLQKLIALTRLYLAHNQINDYTPTKAYYNNLEKRDFDIRVSMSDPETVSVQDTESKVVTSQDKNLEETIEILNKMFKDDNMEVTFEIFSQKETDIKLPSEEKYFIFLPTYDDGTNGDKLYCVDKHDGKVYTFDPADGLKAIK